MRCEAEKALEWMQDTGEVIRAEMLASVGCPVFNTFVRVLNKHLIDLRREKQIIEFPTISEGDR